MNEKCSLPKHCKYCVRKKIASPNESYTIWEYVCGLDGRVLGRAPLPSFGGRFIYSKKMREYFDRLRRKHFKKLTKRIRISFRFRVGEKGKIYTAWIPHEFKNNIDKELRICLISTKYGWLIDLCEAGKGLRVNSRFFLGILYSDRFYNDLERHPTILRRVYAHFFIKTEEEWTHVISSKYFPLASNFGFSLLKMVPIWLGGMKALEQYYKFTESRAHAIYLEEEFKRIVSSMESRKA